MSFTDTWDSAYEALPPDTEQIEQGASRIRQLKVDVRERLAVDHSMAGDDDDGKHTALHLMPQSADPTDPGLYAKTVNGNLEIFFKDTAGNIIQLTNGGVLAEPAGTIKPWPVGTVPTGYLSCNGALVSRTTYARLFDVIGTAYGAGDGSTTFGLPNLLNRGIIGGGSSYGVATSGGASTVTLGINNLPPHAHPVIDPEHTHLQAYSAGAGSAGFDIQSNNHFTQQNVTYSPTGITIGATGGGAPFNIINPYTAMVWIIRT